ncbi:MAG: DUF86 domain-containing protein [Synergistaceae bacterium]|nr:DUF86 domain-containing protein [Synergistaceae bacterium]
MAISKNDRTIIERIIKYCDDIDKLMTQYGRSFERYNMDISFQYSCGMCLIQIGELAGRVSEETTSLNPHIAWRAIKAMRNIHAHDYDNIDYSIVWDSLERDIPELKENLLEILEMRD